jgi:hypothetical protein
LQYTEFVRVIIHGGLLALLLGLSLPLFLMPFTLLLKSFLLGRVVSFPRGFSLESEPFLSDCTLFVHIVIHDQLSFLRR